MAVAAPAVEIKNDRPAVVPAGLGWLVGDFKNGGRELRRKGEPEPVRVHDFEIKGLGKVSPYPMGSTTSPPTRAGSIGIDADTAAFAVESIRRWWRRLGKVRYPNANRLLITADCGRQQRRPRSSLEK
jgi:hypothetical protein